MLAAGVLLRVLAIAVLMVTANHDAGTFAKFFGDEEFYQLRGLRLYNIQMGIPVSMESFLTRTTRRAPRSIRRCSCSCTCSSGRRRTASIC